MNRDNLLFALLGLMVGFITAWFMYDAMSVRQPQRLIPGQAAAMPQGGAGPDMSGAAAGGSAGNQGGAMDPAAGQAAAGAMMNEIVQLRERVEKNPRDAEAVLKLANANFDIQRWDKARELYSRYLELRPGEPDVMTDLGVTYRALGQFDRAIELFDQVQKSSPGHWQSLFNEVIVRAFDLKQFAEAEQGLAELRRLQPGNPDVDRLAAAVERERNSA